MQGEQRRPRHAVLQPGPRRPPQRRRAQRHAVVEPTDAPPEREDLRAGELERRARGDDYPDLTAGSTFTIKAQARSAELDHSFELGAVAPVAALTVIP